MTVLRVLGEGKGIAKTRCFPTHVLAMFLRCVTGPKEFLEAAVRMLDKLATSSPRHPSVEYLGESIVSGSHTRPSGNGKNKKERLCMSKCSRIILPWHPCFSKVQRAVAAMHHHFVDAGFPDLAPVVIYSVGGRSILRRVQAIGKSKVSVEGPGM